MDLFSGWICIANDKKSKKKNLSAFVQNHCFMNRVNNLLPNALNKLIWV